jgi:hypothetical protein
VPARKTRVSAALFKTPLRTDQMLPEYKPFRKKPGKLARTPTGRKLLGGIERMAERLRHLPPLPYTLYQHYERTGSRREFDHAYHARRAGLSAAALRALVSRDREWIDIVQNDIWSLCEETNWVPPEHRHSAPIDLFASETGFLLAETDHLMGDLLEPPVRERIHAEVQRRILGPYLEKEFGWFDGHNNWTGVCESSVGAALLYLEPNPARLSKGIRCVLRGLHRFLDRAFLDDGGSSEGAGYWQYGLINTVAFAELLRHRTRGRVDLLAHPKLPRIARYPLAACVGPGLYHSCSDCAGRVAFSPGFLSRLAERTGTPELTSLLHRDAVGAGRGRLPWVLRDLLWWDGKTHPRPRLDDVLLPETGLARLIRRGPGVVLMAKAGHNRENHNHNDVGSFAVYLRGEPLLCDPGTGLYDRDYFGPRRYDNPVCSSFGHSVPRIGGCEQAFGEEYAGRVESFDAGGRTGRVVLEFAAAYPLKSLKGLRRELALSGRGRRGAAVTLEDRFEFSRGAREVEEAFVTWNRVRVRGAAARIQGDEGTVELRVTEPADARWGVEEFAVRMARSDEPRTLRRLTCSLPGGANTFRMDMTVARSG